METQPEINTQEKPSKAKRKDRKPRAKPEGMRTSPLTKQLDPETANRLSQLNILANKKDFGRKIRDTEIISKALNLINDAHLKELQEISITERDRLKMAYDAHVKVHGQKTMDQFLLGLVESSRIN